MMGRTNMQTDSLVNHEDQNQNESQHQERSQLAMQRSQWKVNKTLDETNLLDYNKLCSICLSDDPIDNESGRSLRSPLVRACLCLGSRGQQHKLCLENWLEQSGSTSCPFCKVRYDLVRYKRSYLDYLRHLVRLSSHAGKHALMGWSSQARAAAISSLPLDRQLSMQTSQTQSQLHLGSIVSLSTSLTLNLGHDFLINLVTFVFCVYLFLVGLAVCLHYISLSSSSSASAGNITWPRGTTLRTIDTPDMKHRLTSSNRNFFSRLFSSYSSANLCSQQTITTKTPLDHYYESSGTYDWMTLILFCLVCIATVILFIFILSILIESLLRHYVKYRLWTSNHFKVLVGEYELPGSK